jgi:hypothetical protein
MVGMFHATRVLGAEHADPLPPGTPQPPPAYVVQDQLDPTKKGLKIQYMRNLPKRVGPAPGALIAGVTASMSIGWVMFGSWVTNYRSVAIQSCANVQEKQHSVAGI